MKIAPKMTAIIAREALTAETCGHQRRETTWVLEIAF
jgi:hypothetical protein